MLVLKFSYNNVIDEHALSNISENKQSYFLPLTVPRISCEENTQNSK